MSTKYFFGMTYNVPRKTRDDMAVVANPRLSARRMVNACMERILWKGRTMGRWWGFRTRKYVIPSLERACMNRWFATRGLSRAFPMVEMRTRISYVIYIQLLRVCLNMIKKEGEWTFTGAAHTAIYVGVVFVRIHILATGDQDILAIEWRQQTNKKRWIFCRRMEPARTK